VSALLASLSGPPRWGGGGGGGAQVASGWRGLTEHGSNNYQSAVGDGQYSDDDYGDDGDIWSEGGDDAMHATTTDTSLQQLMQGAGYSARAFVAAPQPPTLQTSTPTRGDVGRQDASDLAKRETEAAVAMLMARSVQSGGGGATGALRSATNRASHAIVGPRESELTAVAELSRSELWGDVEAGADMLSYDGAADVLARLDTLFGAIPEVDDAVTDASRSPVAAAAPATARDVDHVSRVQPPSWPNFALGAAAASTQSMVLGERVSQALFSTPAMPTPSAARGDDGSGNALKPPAPAFAAQSAAAVPTDAPKPTFAQPLADRGGSADAKAGTKVSGGAMSSGSSTLNTVLGSQAPAPRTTFSAGTKSPASVAKARAHDLPAVGIASSADKPIAAASTAAASSSAKDAMAASTRAQATAAALATAVQQARVWKSPSTSPSKQSRAEPVGDGDNPHLAPWLLRELADAADAARAAATRALPSEEWDDRTKDASPDKQALFRLLRIEASGAARRAEHCTQRTLPAQGGEGREAAAAALAELATAGNSRHVQWARPAEHARSGAAGPRSATPAPATAAARGGLLTDARDTQRAARSPGGGGASVGGSLADNARAREERLTTEQELKLDLLARASLSPRALDAFRAGLRMRRTAATAPTARDAARRAPAPQIPATKAAFASLTQRKRAAPAPRAEPRPQSRWCTCCESRSGARRQRCGRMPCCAPGPRAQRACCLCACVTATVIFFIVCVVACWLTLDLAT
jgi:hypothetical protein